MNIGKGTRSPTIKKDHTMDMKIGAAYIRVSSDDQLEYSPDSQLKVIRDYAAREGYVIPDEFIFREKDGISGKRADKRPAFRLMIATAKAENPPFESIFVWKYSRFARNQEEAIMYKNLLKKRGISVQSISEPSSDSPFSSLIERIIEWMDEYYLINLSGEVRRGMTEKASRGEVMGTAPFGYTCKDKTFIENEHADTVRYIFQEYLSGKTMRQLAADLGDKGVRTRRGNLPDNRFVKYILQNPVYIGKIRWSTEGRAHYSRDNYTGENVMIIDGNHKPIIDMDTWNKVQDKLKGSSREVKYIRKNPVWTLKGLLRCDTCGSTLTQINTASPAYQCHKYAKGQCPTSHSITAKKADALVISALEKIISEQMFTFAPKVPRKGAIVHEWDKLILSEENKLERAKNALLDGAFTSAEYIAIKNTVNDNIAKLRAGKDAEEKANRIVVDIPAYTKKVASVLDVIKSPDIDGEAKNAALRSVIDHITFNKALGTFDIFFSP